MQHHHFATTAGQSTPINDEAHSTPHAAGPRDNVTKRSNFNQSDDWAQSEDMGRMAWLSQQFEKVGLHLYRLGDSTLMVTSISSGIARQLPDLRTAKAFLAMMGGAA